MKNADLIYLSLGELHVSPTVIRQVWKDSNFYQYLLLSVKEYGVLMPILVRPSEKGYEIIKGCHRYHAALDAGLKTIPAQVIHTNDDTIRTMLSMQYNEPKPIELALAILRICGKDTLTEMAKRLYCSLQDIRDLFALHKLYPSATINVNFGHICLANANTLTKLNHDQQELLLQKAITMDPESFYQEVKAKDKQIREERRAAYKGQTKKLICVAHVSREFFQDGESDGTETEFIYEDDLRAESLKGCRTMDEVRVVIQEPPKEGYYWIVTQVQLKDRVII